MILSVVAKLKDIYEQGQNFDWVKPDRCPRCGSVRLWGHGFVEAYFDGFDTQFYLRRYRCPDCACVVRMRPKGFFSRFHASVEVIRSCLVQRLSLGRWNPSIRKSRQRHWLLALKQKALACFGFVEDLMDAFDKLIKMGKIPISRAI
jgi:hypothetical protein